MIPEFESIYIKYTNVEKYTCEHESISCIIKQNKKGL